MSKQKEIILESRVETTKVLFDDFTEREKQIYYAGFGEGWDEALKTILFIFLMLIVAAIITFLLCHFFIK